MLWLFSRLPQNVVVIRQIPNYIHPFNMFRFLNQGDYK